MSFGQPQNAADAFMENETGGGPRGATWKPRGVGDGVLGEIVHVGVLDATDINTGQVKRNEDGSPKKQLVVVIQTDHRGWVAANPLKDAASKQPLGPEHDTGLRAIYAEQGTNRSGAVKTAVANAGQHGAPKVGGRFGIKLVELRDTGKPSPLQIHEAVYYPPAPVSAADGWDPGPAQGQQAAPTPQPQFQQPAQQQGYQPGPAQLAGQPNPAAAQPPAQQQGWNPQQAYAQPTGQQPQFQQPAVQPTVQQQAPAPQEQGYGEPPF